MAEYLYLTTPTTFPSITSWRISNIWLDRETPAIKITFEANTGERKVWRLVPDETITVQQIFNGLSFINQGKFATQQSKSLEQWLLEQWQSSGGPDGSISGTPD